MEKTVPQPAAERLKPWERRGLVALLLVMLAFGLVVEWRGALLKRRMTDLGVFLRAAWAARVGEDFYSVEDNNHWHYCYPPLFAMALTPLADPPPGADRAGMLPFGVSVAVWYGLSLVFLVVAVHWLASALEECSVQAAARGARRWWTLRVLPIVVCLPILGASLVRGQVDALLLMLLCGMTAAVLRGRSSRAGLWLAAAICLKIIPAFLLIYPLWRRDRRWLAGCALGLLIGLVLIPLAVLGPTLTWTRYRRLGDMVLLPALGAGGDRTMARELTATTSTDSQSFVAILHNTLHFDRWTRPPQASAPVRRAHWVIGGLLTLLTLLAARRRTTNGEERRKGEGTRQVLILGALYILMVLCSPVCHLLYFCLAVPVLMGLIASSWESHERAAVMVTPGKGVILLFCLYLVANALPRFPGLEVLRDLGLATYASLLLWGVACVRARWPDSVQLETDRTWSRPRSVAA